MKKSILKKAVALCLTAVMTMSMAAASFAANEGAMPAAVNNGSLTVKVDTATNSLHNQTISLYKLFDLEKTEDTYTYTLNQKYKDTLKASVDTIDEQTADKEYDDEVFKLTGESIQKFADDFTAHVITNKTGADHEQKITETTVTEHTFNNLEHGYYLVYQTGTKELQSALVSVADEARTITLKGDAPSIEKTANHETVEIGQIVKYTITGFIPDTTGYTEYVYKITDTLSDGLDFVDDQGEKPVNADYEVELKIEGKDTSEVGISPAELSGANKRTMTLDLSAWVKKTDTQKYKGKKFTVTYYAKVNSDAVVENTHNSAELEYGNDPNSTTHTKPVVVNTPTYPLDINKTEADYNKMIAGATFRIFRSKQDATEQDADGDASKAIKVTGNNGKYIVTEDQDTPSNMDMITVATEVGTGYNLHLNGLAAGDYWLVETKAPSGYNKLPDPIKITITKDVNDDRGWTVSKGETIVDDKIIDIVNNRGTILPETGGMGTFIFTAVGILMILGVGISFVRSRKAED